MRIDRAIVHLVSWALSGAGPFGTNNTAGNIYLRSLPGLARPDIQIIFTTLGLDSRVWFPGLTKPPVYRYIARGGLLHPEFARLGEIALRRSERQASYLV